MLSFSKIQLIRNILKKWRLFVRNRIHIKILPKKKYKSVMNEHSHKFSNAVYSHIVSMISWSVISVFLEPVFFTIVGKKFFFLHSWSNNQLSCGILRKIFTMREGDYEQIINYDWPKAEYHCCIKSGDVTLIPGFFFVLSPVDVISRKMLSLKFLEWSS